MFGQKKMRAKKSLFTEGTRAIRPSVTTDMWAIEKSLKKICEPVNDRVGESASHTYGTREPISQTSFKKVCKSLGGYASQGIFRARTGCGPCTFLAGLSAGQGRFWQS